SARPGAAAAWAETASSSFSRYARAPPRDRSDPDRRSQDMRPPAARPGCAAARRGPALLLELHGYVVRRVPARAPLDVADEHTHRAGRRLRAANHGAQVGRADEVAPVGLEQDLALGDAGKVGRPA